MRPDKNHPWIRYIRDKKGNKKGIILGCFIDGSPVMGFSLCSPKDKWDRYIGMTIAQVRLTDDPTSYFLSLWPRYNLGDLWIIKAINLCNEMQGRLKNYDTIRLAPAGSNNSRFLRRSLPFDQIS